MTAASSRVELAALLVIALLGCPLGVTADFSSAAARRKPVAKHKPKPKPAKYCPSRVVRGIDFTRTGSYVEYDRPASVADCCHACARQQVAAQKKTGLFVCKAWIMTRHTYFNGSKGGTCLTLAKPLPASVLNARKGTPHNKCGSAA